MERLVFQTKDFVREMNRILQKRSRDFQSVEDRLTELETITADLVKYHNSRIEVLNRVNKLRDLLPLKEVEYPRGGQSYKNEAVIVTDVSCLTSDTVSGVGANSLIQLEAPPSNNSFGKDKRVKLGLRYTPYPPPHKKDKEGERGSMAGVGGMAGVGIVKRGNNNDDDAAAEADDDDDDDDNDEDDWRARFARMQIARDFDCQSFTCNYEEEQALKRIKARRKKRERLYDVSYSSNPDITVHYSDISDADEEPESLSRPIDHPNANWGNGC